MGRKTMYQSRPHLLRLCTFYHGAIEIIFVLYCKCTQRTMRFIREKTAYGKISETNGGNGRPHSQFESATFRDMRHR